MTVNEQANVTSAVGKNSGDKIDEFLSTQQPQEGVSEASQTAAAQELVASECDGGEQPGGDKFGELISKQDASGLLSILADVPKAAVTRRGRPPALTPEIQDQLILLVSVGMSRRQAAAYLNLAHGTIHHTAAKDEDLARRLRRAEELAAVQPMLTVLGEGRKNWRAAAWLIEQRRKYPPALSPEEKAERDQERLADTRRELEVNRELNLLHEKARDAEKARLREKELARLRAENDERFGRRKKSPK